MMATNQILKLTSTSKSYPINNLSVLKYSSKSASMFPYDKNKIILNNFFIYVNVRASLHAPHLFSLNN